MLDVLCDLVQIFDSQGKDAIEDPVSVGPGVGLSEYQLYDLLVAEAVKKLFVDLEVAVVDYLGLDCVNNNRQDFVHALPVAKLRVVLRPQIEQIRHVLLGVLPCVELDILHRTLDVFLDDVSELTLLFDQVDFEFLRLITFLDVASDLIVIAVV